MRPGGAADQNPQLRADMLQQFLENQEREIELKTRELELQKQVQQHNFEYANTALQAQANDRKITLEHASRSRRESMLWVIAIALIIFGFASYALYLGKDRIVEVVIQAIAFVIVGGGGYEVGKRSGRGKSAPKEDIDDDADSG